jgi:hypothetical protein
MNEDKRLCSLFKDLYPSYVDEILEDETKLWMDRHIEDCTDCLKWTKEHKEVISTNESIPTIKEDDSTFQEDKKTIRKAKIVIALGLVAVIMLAIWTSIWMFM